MNENEDLTLDSLTPYPIRKAYVAMWDAKLATHNIENPTERVLALCALAETWAKIHAISASVKMAEQLSSAALDGHDAP